MNNTEDFFRKKLDDANISPRPAAWQRVEANLSKKNNGLAWFRLAAAILLIGLLTATLFYLQTASEPSQMANTPNEIKPKTEEGSKTDEQKAPRNGTVQQSEDQPAQRPVKAEQHLREEMPAEAEPVPRTVAQLEVNENENENETDSLGLTTVAAAAVEKPMVIEYVLTPIPSVKDEMPEVAELAEKKSGLQRALEFARDAKHSDNPLGGLRQAKDELFALDFRKDKPKKQ